MRTRRRFGSTTRVVHAAAPTAARPFLTEDPIATAGPGDPTARPERDEPAQAPKVDEAHGLKPAPDEAPPLDAPTAAEVVDEEPDQVGPVALRPSAAVEPDAATAATEFGAAASVEDAEPSSVKDPAPALVEDAAPAEAAAVQDAAPAAVEPIDDRATAPPGDDARRVVADGDDVTSAHGAQAGVRDSPVTATSAAVPAGATAVGFADASEPHVPARGRPRRTGKAFARIAAIIPVLVIVAALVLFFGRLSGHKATTAAGVTATGTVSGSSTGPGTSSSSGSPSSDPSISGGSDTNAAAQTNLGHWAKANLSTAAVIVADAKVAKTLRSAGFTHVVRDTSTSTDWHMVAYLIRGRDGAHPSALRTKLAAASAPVAEFGSGTGELTVSEVHPELGSDLAARIRADRLARHQAGTELVKNPMIRFSPSAKKVVSAGKLDIRPASFLVQLGRTTPVYVIDIVCNAAESRAGRPCRTIVVSTGDMNMLQQTVSTSALDYKPTSVDQIDHDAVRLQWIPAIVSIAGG